jgi:hypothetical protein
MNSAGRDSAVPSISVVEEIALSSFDAVLRPSKTQGRCSGHCVVATLQLPIAPLHLVIARWKVSCDGVELDP